MTLLVDSSVAPYNDDFNKDKNFLRILYNPERAVQARELTQAQTILQNQLSSASSHLFVNGSRILGSEITVDFKRHVLVVTTDTASSAVDISGLAGSNILDTATGTEIVATISYVDVANNALVLEYTGGLFTTSDSFQVDGTGTDYKIDSTHYGITASMAPGIVYTEGFFVQTFAQDILVDASATALDVTTQHHLGWVPTDSFITENDDVSLTDNATGAYNAGAPGAHRLNRELTLTSYKEGTSVPANFEGSITTLGDTIESNVNKEVKYSEILDLLARRTHDESGSYVTEEFNMLPIATLTGNTATQLDIEVGAGKAYVFGYEVENRDTKELTINKSQTFLTETLEHAYTDYGPYLDIQHASGTIPDVTGDFDVAGNESIKLYISRTAADAGLSGTANGEISVAGVDPKLASLKRNANGELRVSIFDSQGISAQFSSVKAIRGSTSGAVATVELYDGVPVLGNTEKPEMLFSIQESNIKEIVSDTVSYDVTKSFTGTATGAGRVRINTGVVGDKFLLGNDRVVYINNTTEARILSSADYSVVSGTYTDGTFVDIDLAPADFNDNVTVFIQVERTATSKNKTLVDVSAGQVFATPASSTLTLADYDVIDVYEVSMTGHSTITDGVVPTDNYGWSTGQTDVAYDAGYVVLDGTYYDAAATYTVKYKHFTHGSAGDYFSVNSYSSVDWSEVGTYIAKSGTNYELTDCLDFRKGPGIAGLYPTVQENTTFDYNFYLSRIDKVYVDKDGNFGTITGIPGKTPFPPADKSDAMTLATVTVSPYTGILEGVTIDLNADKTYTMSEIRELEGRISRLEEYSSLNLLEQEAKDLLVQDAYGNTRFKNGIFVDNFESHDIGNVDDLEYACAMDTQEGFIHSLFTQENQALTQNFADLAAAQAANIAISDTNITNSSSGVATLDYSTVPFISQTLASDKINVNPYAVFSWNNGKLALSPSSDFWYDDKLVSTIRNTVGSHAKAGVWRFAYTTWSGWRRRTRTTVNTTVTRTPTTNRTINDRVIAANWIHKMRSRVISFWAANMRPNTNLIAKFDGKDVTAYCTASLKTDAQGNIGSKASPKTFTIPANTFNTGRKTFELVDTDATTSAASDYSAKGILRKHQKTITTIKGIRTTISTTRRTWGDPIAQSFFVANPSGVFLSSVDLYFASKDSSLPVSVEIVEMLAGQPTMNSIPMSLTVVPAASVNVGSQTTSGVNDSTLATNFEFEAPVYLQGNQSYAIVVKTNSTKYELFHAKMTRPKLNTGNNINANNNSGQGIAKQPYAGVMFKSQNAETWTEDQNSDLKFVLNRCKFDIATPGIIEFESTANSADKFNQMNANLHNIEYGDTNIKFEYKIPNGTNNVPAYTEFSEGDEIEFLNVKDAPAAVGVSNIFVQATLTSTDEYISPVMDVTRSNVTTLLNTVGPDVHSSGMKHCGNYISKSTVLSEPAEDIKVILDAKLPSQTAVNVYVSTTPYVAKYALRDLNQTGSSYTELAGKNVNIYHVNTGTDTATLKGGFIPTRFGNVSGGVHDGLSAVWIKDIVDANDLTLPATTKIIAVEGSLVDLTIPNWSAGTYNLGDNFFHTDGEIYQVTATTTSTVPSPVAADWKIVPSMTFSLVASQDGTFDEAESAWRLCKKDAVPAGDVNTTSEFQEYTYVPEALPDEDFKAFSIKVEMLAVQEALVPEVAKLRAIAVT